MVPAFAPPARCVRPRPAAGVARQLSGRRACSGAPRASSSAAPDLPALSEPDAAVSQPARPAQAAGAAAAAGAVAPSSSLPQPSSTQRSRMAPAAGAAAAQGPPRRPLGDGNSTWGDTEHWAAPGQDVLVRLGQQDGHSMRIDMGQRAGLIDDLFVGKFLGLQADIASGALRNQELRTFGNLVGDWMIPARFAEAVKNHLASKGELRGVPLILGIWGAKGAGKSFNTELVCRLMGVQPVVVSAGELEDEYAGEPGRRIRARYRTASQNIRNSGVMSCLIINDLDAGCGRFARTQVTVNNQIVMGTLMNLCDHPERASVGESWREDLTLARVPIIVTANDLSTLYAPLLRDGRMEKFYWEPTRDEKADMLHELYRDDGLDRGGVESLLDAFPAQALDFFGALRSRRHDAALRAWAAALGEERLARALRAGLRRGDGYAAAARHGGGDADYGREAAAAAGGRAAAEGDPDAAAADPGADPLPDLSASGAVALADLLAAGQDLEREQEAVMGSRLSDDYMRVMREGQGVGLNFG